VHTQPPEKRLLTPPPCLRISFKARGLCIFKYGMVHVHYSGLLIFRGKKAKFHGIFRGKFAEKLADFAGEKLKVAEKSADFT